MTSQAPSCAACGETSGLYWHVYAPDIGNAQLCSCASWRSLDENVERVRARRGLAVEAPKLCECCGVRKADRFTGNDSAGAEWSSAVSSYSIKCWQEEFARSGKNYLSAMAAFFEKVRTRRRILSSGPVGTGNAQSSVPGEPACANDAHYFSAGEDICVHCGIWRMHTYEHAHEQSTVTHCPECPTALTPETVGRTPFCRVCTERRQLAAGPSPLVPRCRDCNAPGFTAPGSGGRCVYSAHSHGISANGKHWREVSLPDRESADDEIRDDMSTRVSEIKPRKRLAAMAQERPSGNRAQKRMLELGHPVGWPSIGDDEP